MDTIHESNAADDESENSDSSSTLTTDLSPTVASETSVLVVSNVLPVDLHLSKKTLHQVNQQTSNFLSFSFDLFVFALLLFSISLHVHSPFVLHVILFYIAKTKINYFLNCTI